MKKTKSYSGLFILDPEKEGSIDELKNSISAVISDNSGNVSAENMMGKKRLAYPIKKKTEGIYYEVVFTALPDSIARMMKQFLINTDILRTLINTQK